jgi:FKBP-type peptidyl-prolyl cis-trans isomerase 2
MREYLKNIKIISITALLGLPLVGCSTVPVVVQQGDTAEVNFTCRLPDGSLAVTTRPNADVAGEKKSPLYLPRIGPETVAVKAVETVRQPGLQGVKDFELIVLDLLGPRSIGATTGERRSLELVTPRYNGLPKNEEYISIARIRHYPKVIRMTPEEYTGRTGVKAEVGQPYSLDLAFPGKVSEVAEKEVVIRVSAQAGATVATAFGSGIVRENDSEYSYSIDAVKGTLVRTAGMVGRIVDVREDSIGLDYGHPFGGEPLQCDVTVKSVEAAAQAAAPAPVAAPAAAPAVSPTAARKELLNSMLADALANGTEAGATIENFDKDFASREAKSAQAPAVVGDLATVNYQATLEDGSLFYTTRKEVAENPALKKVTWYAAQSGYAPEAVPVGKAALLPGIGEALIGMKAGESKRLTLTPEQAFGQPDPGKRKEIPLMVTLPKVFTLPAEEYVKRAESFPVVGKELQLTPYFSAKVIAVREREVEMEFQAEDGKSYVEPFGTTNVKMGSKEIVTTLTPVIGASFPLQEGSGIIIASDGKTFSVDQNNPLAGKTVTIDLELTALTPAATLSTAELPWLADHDAGLAAAKKEGKPAVLVLHAEWCSFCKKLFSETMPDPRITALRNSFTWIKVNSDKLTDYKKLYGQDGYPMIVLFKADGTIVQKLDGYQEAAQLRSALLEVM